MKKLFIIICCLSLLIPINIKALKKSSNIYVTDQAKLLSKETKEYIVTYSSFLKDNNDIDYYVVTVDSTNDKDLDKYADELYDSFNISNRGLLILYIDDERVLKVITGSEMGNIITNDIISEYIDSYFMPYLSKEKWDAGIKNGYSSFFKLLCNYYDIDSSSMEVYSDVDFVTKYKIPLILIVLVLCVAISYPIGNIIFMFNKKNTITNVILVVLILINIGLLIFSYTLDPVSVLAITAFEITSLNKCKQNKKKVRKKVRKR